MKEKLNRALIWIYDNPELIFSAYFIGLAISQWDKFSVFCMLIATQQLFQFMTKQRNRLLRMALDQAVVRLALDQECINALTSKLSEYIGQEEIEKIFTEYHHNCENCDVRVNGVRHEG